MSSLSDKFPHSNDILDKLNVFRRKKANSDQPRRQHVRHRVRRLISDGRLHQTSSQHDISIQPSSPQSRIRASPSDVTRYAPRVSRWRRWRAIADSRFHDHDEVGRHPERKPGPEPRPEPRPRREQLGEQNPLVRSTSLTVPRTNERVHHVDDDGNDQVWLQELKTLCRAHKLVKVRKGGVSRIGLRTATGVQFVDSDDEPGLPSPSPSQPSRPPGTMVTTGDRCISERDYAHGPHPPGRNLAYQPATPEQAKMVFHLPASYPVSIVYTPHAPPTSDGVHGQRQSAKHREEYGRIAETPPSATSTTRHDTYSASGRRYAGGSGRDGTDGRKAARPLSRNTLLDRLELARQFEQTGDYLKLAFESDGETDDGIATDEGERLDFQAGRQSQACGQREQGWDGYGSETAELGGGIEIVTLDNFDQLYMADGNSRHCASGRPPSPARSQ